VSRRRSDVKKHGVDDYGSMKEQEQRKIKKELDDEDGVLFLFPFNIFFFHLFNT